jgi:hypothetical protein
MKNIEKINIKNLYIIIEKNKKKRGNMSEVKLRIAIDIEDIIRDFSGKFIEQYNSFYNPTKDVLVKQEKIETEEIVDIFNIVKPLESENKLTIENFDLCKMRSYFSSQEECINFLYEESVTELFAFSNETFKNCVIELNRINEIGKEMGVELSLTSFGIGKSVSATYHFLGKTFCQIPKVVIVDYYNNMLNNVDYLLTTDYNFFENDKCIKFNTQYNKDKECTHTIDHIKHLPQLFEQLLDNQMTNNLSHK